MLVIQQVHALFPASLSSAVHNEQPSQIGEV